LNAVEKEQDLVAFTTTYHERGKVCL